MNSFDDRPGQDKRRRNTVAPNPWRRGRRRPQPHESTLGAARAPQNGSSHRPMLAALFDDASHAERAHATLVDRGYRHEEIVVVMAEAKWEKLFGASESARRDTPSLPAEKPERRATDTPVPVAIPSPDLPARAMAAGRLAAMLANAARPRSENALREALIDCGIPARNAAECAAGVESGKILLGVVPRTDADATLLGDEWLRGDGEVPGR